MTENKAQKVKGDILLIVLFLIPLIALSLATQVTFSYSAPDFGDYIGVAKFFAGELNAKTRSSHSVLYGLIHYPLVLLSNDFILLKIASLLYLVLIVFSVYYISNKSRNALLIFLLSPLLWYMGPFIHPIFLSTLFFLWGYYFIKKYDLTEKISFLCIAALFVGVAWAFWDAILLFSIILGISFLYNKKLYHSGIYVLFLFIGLMPKLIIDQILFNFAFFGIIRYASAIATAVLFGGIYGTDSTGIFSPFLRLINLILIFLLIPLHSYKLFEKDKKTFFFITFSVVMAFTTLLLRPLFLIVPIAAVNLAPILNKKQFKIQAILSVIMIILVVSPYIVQLKYSINDGRAGKIDDVASFMIDGKKLEISENYEKTIEQDLNEIAKDFPAETFVVGNTNDMYKKLALTYWGGGIKEFVSIEDYNLYLENKSEIFSKTFSPIPNINDRRTFFVSGGIIKNPNDFTDYRNIKFAISDEENINLENFKFVKKYSKLYVFRKAN